MSLSLQTVADQINREFANKSSMKVGKTIQHPDGRMVKIMSGRYLSNGRVSNFWQWREVKADGSLGKEESGYGW